MGREWDGWESPAAFQRWCHAWAIECLRVLKPGGHMLAFGGTRTWHRLTCGIEDAGFEIRDGVASLTGQDAPGLMWVHGQGFPKSRDMSKDIDKMRNDRPDILRVTSWLADVAEAKGVSRAQVDAHMGTSDMGGWWLSRLEHRCAIPTWEQWAQLRGLIGFGDEMDAEVWRLNGRKGTPGEAWEQREITQPGVGQHTPGDVIGWDQRSSRERERRDVPTTEDAARWSGWGTALKPAWEPIVVARKPVAGRTVAANVLEFGTGALNIDGCKVATADNLSGGAHARNGSERHDGTEHWRYKIGGAGEYKQPDGRWPANVVFTHSASCDGRCAPDCPAGELDRQSGVLTSGGRVSSEGEPGSAGWRRMEGRSDAATRQTAYDRKPDTGGASRFYPTFRYQAKAPASERPRLEDGTAHETVKPLGLMSWLVRLITPPGGTVLDLFAGSGPVAEACIIEGFRCVLIEQDAKSCELIKTRLSKSIQPAMFRLEDSAPAAPVRPAAASRPRPVPEVRASLFDDLESAS